MKLGATLKSTGPSVADHTRQALPTCKIKSKPQSELFHTFSHYYSQPWQYIIHGSHSHLFSTAYPWLISHPVTLDPPVLLRFSDGLPSTAPPRRDDDPGFAPWNTHRFLPFPISSQHFLCCRNLSFANEQAQPAIFRDQLRRHWQRSLKLLDGTQRHQVSGLRPVLGAAAEYLGAVEPEAPHHLPQENRFLVVRFNQRQLNLGREQLHRDPREARSRADVGQRRRRSGFTVSAQQDPRREQRLAEVPAHDGLRIAHRRQIHPRVPAQQQIEVAL